ncbi:MAG: nuclear transport factor 2 family protein [Myxococcales bacterium]
MARDVLIHTRLSTGLQIVVPAHLLYEIDGTKILRMRAIWDLRKRTSGALTSGWLGFKTLMAMSWTMLSSMGLGGTLAYSRGMFVGIFGRGRSAVDALAAAVRAKDAGALAALFAPSAVVELPVGTRVEPKALLDALPGFGVEQATPAGWMTSFRFTLEGGRRGLAFLEFDPASKRIASARFFGAS